MNKKNILVLGAHTDDGEWGCGASINKWALQGARITYIAMSAAEESVKPEYPKNILRSEILVSAKILGIPPDSVRVLNFPVRHFPRYRQEILEALVAIRSEINPDLVVVHSSTDTHQDHEVMSSEAFRAFKRASILGFELPHNCRISAPAYFSVVDDSNINSKIHALESYKSQLWRVDGGFKDLMFGIATMRGCQVGVKYAEAFEVMRWVD